MNQASPLSITAEELKNWLEGEPPYPLLIDVRESEELEIAHLPFKTLHLPLSESDIWINNYQEKLNDHHSLVVLCHKGIRSWNFCNWLINQNCDFQVWNLEGGIHSWSQEIDPNIPIY